MLDGLLQAIENLQSFSFVEAADSVTQYSSQEILDIIRFQLEHGINGDGERLYLINPNTGRKSFRYSATTVQNKLQFGYGIGAIVENITLYDTGEFYSSLYVRILENGDFEVSSTDAKYPLLIEKSGDKILTISPEADDVLQERYLTSFQVFLDKELS